MKLNQIMRICSILAIAGIALFGAPASAAIQTYLGDIVPLSGYSYSGNYVYLFLTGPNLPPNGVALDNLGRPADQGATQVPVDGDGHWEYKWGTNSGGRLDAGVYTVWVTDGPADRSHLAYVDYSTIGVDLTKPYISVNGPAQPVVPGSMELNSTPDAASVVVNDAFRGTTPLTLGGLDPGVYNVTFSKFGYAKVSTPVKVEAGSISQVNAALVLQLGSVAVNTSPDGANVSLDGTDEGLSPLVIGNVMPGNHTLTVSKEGFPGRTLDIRVAGDQTTIADIALASPQETTPTRLPGSCPATLGGVLVTAIVLGLISRSRK